MSNVDQAAIYRAQAMAKRTKSGQRVSSDTVLAKVVSFLNNANLQFLAVENTFPASTKHSSIVSRFRNVIIENKLDELVYPILADDHVMLIKLTAEVTETDDDDTENDN
jgi:hypothetical protein